MSLRAVILLHLGICLVHDAVDSPCIIFGVAKLKADKKFAVRFAFAKRHISLIALIYPSSAFEALPANRAKR